LTTNAANSSNVDNFMARLRARMFTALLPLVFTLVHALEHREAGFLGVAEGDGFHQLRGVEPSRLCWFFAGFG
jgi:hypothetical protein